MLNQDRAGVAVAEDPVVAALRRMVAGEAANWSERALADGLGVTRHRLRRALATLRASGAAPETERRRGTVSRSGEAMIRATNPVEVIELRMALEPALARLAALRASPFEIAAIERAATTAASTDSGVADLAFHRLVAAGSGNRLAAEFYALLRQVGTDARLRVARDRPVCPNRVRQRDAEHRAVAVAIATRDPDGAAHAMRLHLDAVHRQIQARLLPSVGAA